MAKLVGECTLHLKVDPDFLREFRDLMAQIREERKDQDERIIAVLETLAPSLGVSLTEGLKQANKLPRGMGPL